MKTSAKSGPTRDDRVPYRVAPMTGHGGHTDPGEHHGPHEIHLPSPTVAPAVIALGVMLIAFGILFGPILAAVGGVIMLAGLATWLINDAREYARAGDRGEHGGH